MPAKDARALKAKVDDRLDQALQDSFPASDPISFIEPGPVKPGDMKLPTVEASGKGPTTRAASRRGKARRKATRS
jgi:hypothetical protein